MKLIMLSQGKFAQVDDEDFWELNKHKWCTTRGKGNTFYAQRSVRINGKARPILMHRVIMNAPPRIQCDHLDGDGLNNQRSNLRFATNQENNRNKVGPNRNNKLGVKGVCWNKRTKKFEADITVDGKTIHLGFFFCLEKAKLARRAAEAKYFGAFAHGQGHVPAIKSEEKYIADRPDANPNNKLGIKGIGWHKQHKKFAARIRVGGKLVHLGYFFCLEKAKLAYRRAKLTIEKSDYVEIKTQTLVTAKGIDCIKNLLYGEGEGHVLEAANKEEYINN